MTHAFGRVPEQDMGKRASRTQSNMEELVFESFKMMSVRTFMSDGFPTRFQVGNVSYQEPILVGLQILFVYIRIHGSGFIIKSNEPKGVQ
ncbi:hypothetical protein RSAG8_00923, partial [Rhizoctonia solani AG-8 WAC10335]